MNALLPMPDKLKPWLVRAAALAGVASIASEAGAACPSGLRGCWDCMRISKFADKAVSLLFGSG